MNLKIKIDKYGNLVNLDTDTIILASNELFTDSFWETDGTTWKVNATTQVTASTNDAMPTVVPIGEFTQHSRVDFYFRLHLPILDYNKRVNIFEFSTGTNVSSDISFYKLASSNGYNLYTSGDRQQLPIASTESLDIVGVLTIYNIGSNTIAVFITLYSNEDGTLTKLLENAYRGSGGNRLYFGVSRDYHTNLSSYMVEGIAFDEDIIINPNNNNINPISAITKYLNGTGLSEVWTNTKNYIASQLLGKSDVGHTHSASEITDLPSGLTVDTTLDRASSNAIANSAVSYALDNKANSTHIHALESLASNSIPFHNAYPRCKYLGTTITDAQNTAIKNRTYDDLFIGDYWTINGINWRIVAIDYYYNIGDTNFNKGNLIVMPDTVLYNAQMNETNTTAGAYAGSLMRTQNLNNARTIAQNAFGSHLANHRILLANSVDSSGPNSWGWYGSDGVELPNEVQIYGTRVWGSALKGWDVATQKQQFPLMLLAPQFVNTRQTYWLQDVSSYSVSSLFANVHYDGYADFNNASYSRGVRPAITLSYI